MLKSENIFIVGEMHEKNGWFVVEKEMLLSLKMSWKTDAHLDFYPACLTKYKQELEIYIWTVK